MGIDADVRHARTDAARPVARRDGDDGAERDPAPTRAPARPAFTLVELLVVVGIMVVLVALLLPSLVAVRSLRSP